MNSIIVFIINGNRYGENTRVYYDVLFRHEQLYEFSIIIL